MKLGNVKLILFREVRDQLRDRRTLFMIAVLPILLYPLLGMSFLQIAQFRREHSARVLLIGSGQLKGLPPLADRGRFAADLFSEPEKAALVEVEFFAGAEGPDPRTAEAALARARRAVQAGLYDAALFFPPDFARRVASRTAAGEIPQPEIIYTTATDRSQIACVRLTEILRAWNDRIIQRRLESSGLPASAARPFELRSADVAAGAGYKGAAAWSKILPVLLLIWSLTGAFYPAIDLCAGEKERGTLETLLCSPAQRSEIVLGKLLTIMIFSMVTAVLNLLTIALTGWMLLSKAGMGLPPPLAALWLFLALVPVAALFSALSLALAAFARSTKEGQYYLMPLLLVTMPLAVLPTAPGVDLNLGNSLIPVTGIVLLLRNMIEGNYLSALRFAAPVIGVTLICCLLSIRWAVEQFNSESVLFREGERLDVGLWMRHLVRDRRATPTVGEAVLCGLLILVIRFFLTFSVSVPDSRQGFVVLLLVTQLAVIVAPTLIMTLALTRSPRQTLLIRWPRWAALAAAALLAVVLHPAVMAVHGVVNQLYPISGDARQAIEAFLKHAPDLTGLVLLMAVVPGICEELAFRGFVLSGLRKLGHPGRAIVYSALLFGLTHSILQQSLVAALLGLVLGLIAVRTGSIFPCMVFHVIHNSIGMAVAKLTQLPAGWDFLRGLVQISGGEMSYDWRLTALSSAAALLLLAWFWRQEPLETAK